MRGEATEKETGFSPLRKSETCPLPKGEVNPGRGAARTPEAGGEAALLSADPEEVLPLSSAGCVL